MNFIIMKYQFCRKNINSVFINTLINLFDVIAILLFEKVFC